MKKTLFTVMLAAAFALNGCASLMNGAFKLPPLQYRVKVERNVMTPMSDGVALASDVYHPAGLAPSPVILVRTPYDKDAPGVIGYFESRLMRLLAGHGYTVVVQDCRGRYASQGDFYPFVSEHADGHETLAWAASAPWSNGRVGSWGGSYFGFTQWAMADGSENLFAMVPLVTSADISQTFYEGGAVDLANMFSWAVTNEGRTGRKVAERDVEKGLRTLPLIEADNAAINEDVPFYEDIISYRMVEKKEQLNYQDRFQEVSAPGFFIAGWYDLFQKYEITDFQHLISEAREPARSLSRIIIGPWGHGPFSKPAVKFKNGGLTQMGQLDKMIAFYDQTLKGEPRGVESWPVYSIYVMGKDEWVGLNDWPPAGMKPTDYFLHSYGHANTKDGDGALSPFAPEAESADRFSYDPADPVPTAGGPLLGADLGPKDQAKVEARSDVLVYTGEAVSVPLTLMGPISVTVYAASNAPDTDFTAKLCDLYPNGLSVNITDGIVRARFRSGDLKHSEPIEPGQVYEYTIDLWQTAYVFLPGHKIRLQISSSNFPRFDRNLNTGEDIATSTTMRPASQTIFHDPERPSRLTLPVVE
jgi:hypothetical protein